MPRRDRDRLVDILEAIDRIERYTTPQSFEAHPAEIIWDAVAYNLLVVGEAAAHVSDDVRARAAVDWRRIVALRNVIAHEYFDVQREMIGNTVSSDIPALRHAVTGLLAGLDD
ncbi:MAG TPA: HepT-like ribonuclease domain-containing protein [Actinomycetota bacterium]|nr:HepT-like ribonuclease domain-containing protein [Actinomycetota bacterium]